MRISDWSSDVCSSDLFVRRHRAVSAAIAVAVLALISGAAVSLYYAVSEARAHAIAERHAAEFAAVNRFLNTMLVSADPAHTRGRAVTVVETLDAARAQLPVDRSLTPDTRAALAATLSNTYVALGDVETGLAIARDARTTTERALGANSEAAIRLRLAEASALHRSEEHTSELQSLMRISYAVFCLKKKTIRHQQP